MRVAIFAVALTAMLYPRCPDTGDDCNGGLLKRLITGESVSLPLVCTWLPVQLIISYSRCGAVR